MSATALRRAPLLVALGVVYLSLMAVRLVEAARQHDRPPLRTSGAMRALDFWAQSRAYPDRVLPDRGFAEAFAYSRAQLQAPAPKAGALWRAMGPGNVGGRTLAVVFNPQNPHTIYAGSAGGGLWRSRTSGVGVAAWEYVPTGHPVLAVSTIAIAPQDSNVIYIGTGEVYAYQNALGGIASRTTRGVYGIGILKSTDGGVTWTKSLDWTRSQRRGVWAVRIDASNPSRVFAATTEGVYRSLDAGVNWTQVHSVRMAMDLELLPSREDTVLVACGNLNSIGHGIYRSLNGGTTWAKLTNGLPNPFGGKPQLAVTPADPFTVYASIGNGFSENAGTWLTWTTTAGDLWQTLSTLDYSTYQGWFSHDVAVDPQNRNHAFAAGVDIYELENVPGLLAQRSDWTQFFFGAVPVGGPEGNANYSHADHHAITWHPTDPDVIYFANDGGIFRTLDGGTTFEGCNGGYQTGQFYSGFSSAAADTQPALGGLQDNYTAIFAGSAAWNRQIGGDGGWTAIDPTDPQTLYASWQFLNMLRSDNGGVDWVSITPPSGASATAFIAPFALAPSSPNTLYAARNLVYYSVNQGRNWTGGGGLNGRVVLTIAVSPSDPQLVYVGTEPDGFGNGIFKSINGGLVWLDVTRNLPDRYPADLAFDPINNNIVYVTYAGFGTSHVFKTTDGAATWQDIGASLPDVPAQAVVVDPLHSQHVYLGNDIGVYVSYNGGGTWQELREGLPDAVMCMDLSIQPSHRRLRLATHGNGVYERPLLEGAVAAPVALPTAGLLASLRNAPNPFNPRTIVSLELVAPATVDLELFDLAGRRVRVLALAQALPAGPHAWTWDGRDDVGAAVASGTYVARATAAGQTLTHSLALVR